MKNINIILNILHLFLKKKEIFHKLVDERLKKINDLDKNVNRDDLIYRYKCKVADTKFNEFDNALDIINNTRDGKKDLTDVKKKNSTKFLIIFRWNKKGC